MGATDPKAVSRPTIVRTSVPRRARLHFPRTFEDRADLGVRELRVPATFEEYLALANDCDYRLHYREGHIISFLEINDKTGGIMGEASVTHEALVMRLGRLLADLLEGQPDGPFHILGSNTKIFIAEDRRGFNADVTVVRGEILEQGYKFNRRTVTGITNPWLIVEVLSPSTRDFDLSEKLQDYKQIPSLQQVIFINQGSVWASTFIRAGRNEWRNLDFLLPEDALPVHQGEIGLERIYAGIPEGPLGR